MNKLWIGAAAVGALAGMTYFNYRRMVPKPMVLGDTKYDVSREEVSVLANGHMLYGELLRPKGMDTKLPTVICCHGFSSSYKACKTSVGLSLAKSGYAVYCFDFYGGGPHSKSGGSMTEMSIFTEQKELEDVIRAVRKLPSTDENALFLLGQSQGGCVSAMTAPLFAEEICGLILYFPALCITDDARKRFSSVEEIPETTRAFGHKVGRCYYEKLLDYDVYAAIGGYKKPVLILHGDKDTMVPMSYGEKAAEVYENAEFVRLPGEIHGFTTPGKQTAAKKTYDFIRRCLSSEGE